jgi:hypothetical protein
MGLLWPATEPERPLVFGFVIQTAHFQDARSVLVLVIFLADELLDRDSGSLRQAKGVFEQRHATTINPLMNRSI